MTKEKLKDYLVSLGFTYERDDEFNRDVYTNNLFFVANKNTKLVIYICYYTMRFEWWYESNKKIGTSFYLSKILSMFSGKFIIDTIKNLQEKYNIKIK